ncbi:MAG: hypothetical protein H8E84_07440 [Flavobacteriales bacterium]|nr:hypothetical protein [Flavobacteriales bacterium]
MKKIFYLLFVCSFLFTSCEEDVDDPFSPSSSFICKIDGVQLSDSAPITNIITTNPALNGALEIIATSNLKDGTVMNTVNVTVYDFSSVTENTTLSLGSSGSGAVWKGADTYVTSIPNFTGTVSFSKITANKVSGTFSFEALNTDNSATKVVVSEGAFTDVSY